MKVRDLLDQATGEVQSELEKRKLEQLKEQLREVKAAELTLNRLKRQLDKFLEEPVDHAVFDG